MPIELKTREQIAILREAGRIVAEVYEVLRPRVVPGVTTLIARAAQSAVIASCSSCRPYTTLTDDWHTFRYWSVTW